MPVQIRLVDVTHKYEGKETTIAQFVHGDGPTCQWVGIVTSNNRMYPTQIEIQTVVLPDGPLIPCAGECSGHDI